MSRRVIPDAPRFRLRWLATVRDRWPAWLEDPSWVPAGERAVYSRVKDGLRAVLEDLDREGPVLLPSYVPGGVVWAALDAGYDVRYYPVSEDLTLPVEAVADRIATLEPAAVVFIHYFGFVDGGFDDLRAATRDAGALVVEDCARGLFSRDRRGRLLGSTGDLALFCLYKTLPAPNGGLVVSGSSLPDPDGTRSERLEVLRAGGASLLAAGGIRGDRSTPVVEEDVHRGTGTVASSADLQAPGALSRRALRRTDPESVRSARLDRYRDLRERLVDAGVDVVTPRAPPEATPYGVGLMAPSQRARADLYAALHERRLPGEVLTWPPVHRHTVVNGLDETMALRRRLVVLPTHQQVPRAAVADLADCVTDHLP